MPTSEMLSVSSVLSAGNTPRRSRAVIRLGAGDELAGFLNRRATPGSSAGRGGVALERDPSFSVLST
jgi:hypothetical protein